MFIWYLKPFRYNNTIIIFHISLTKHSNYTNVNILFIKQNTGIHKDLILIEIINRAL